MMANFRGANLRGRGSYSDQVNVSTSSVNPQEDQRNVSISRTGRGGVAFDRSGSGSHQYGRGGVLTTFDEPSADSSYQSIGQGYGRGTSTPSFPNRGGLGNGNTVHPVGTYNNGSYVRNVIPTESHTSGVKQEELKQEEAGGRRNSVSFSLPSFGDQAKGVEKGDVVPERYSTDVAASLPQITQDTLNKLADVSAKFLDAFSDLNAIFQQLRR
uniref:Uncharacterized protein n=1 Tax=Ditylenchus dipsaci TaxID=166011 RepID=A0A915D5J3_9BILA